MDACLNPLSFISLWVQQQEVVLQRYLSKLVIIDKDKNSDQLRPLNFFKYCIYSQSFSTTVRNTVDKWGKSHWKYIFYITSSKYFEIFFYIGPFYICQTSQLYCRENNQQSKLSTVQDTWNPSGTSHVNQVLIFPHKSTVTELCVNAWHWSWYR